MKGMKPICKATNEKEESKLFFSILIAVFAWGLAAHGYAFANLTLSHDSLNEFLLDGLIGYSAGTVADWKISLGRFLFPIYQTVFLGKIATPWLNGMLALLWLTLAVWFMARMFSIRNRISIILLAGICTANLTVSALAGTYIGDLSINMFAVCAAACGAFCWSKGGKRACLLVPAAYIALGIYQSMLSVAITLILFMSILRLLKNADARGVFLDGLKAVGMIVLAGALYLLSTKLVCLITNVEMSTDYNGLSNLFLFKDTSILHRLISTYTYCIRTLFEYPSLWPNLVTILLFALFCLITGICVFRIVLKGKLKPVNIVFALALTALLPFGMNLSYFVDNGIVHLLMIYSFWLVYMIPLLLQNEDIANGSQSGRMDGILRITSILVILVILWSNVETSNVIYVKKHLEREATLSKMTRVVDRIEQTENYDPGETEVIILGIPENRCIDGLEKLHAITGTWDTTPISSEHFYQNYFKYVQQIPIRLLDYLEDGERYEQILETCKDMPIFPAEDSIRWVDGSLVVKMSE